MKIKKFIKQNKNRIACGFYSASIGFAVFMLGAIFALIDVTGFERGYVFFILLSIADLILSAIDLKMVKGDF